MEVLYPKLGYSVPDAPADLTCSEFNNVESALDRAVISWLNDEVRLESLLALADASELMLDCKVESASGSR